MNSIWDTVLDGAGDTVMVLPTPMPSSGVCHKNIIEGGEIAKRTQGGTRGDKKDHEEFCPILFLICIVP